MDPNASTSSFIIGLESNPPKAKCIGFDIDAPANEILSEENKIHVFSVLLAEEKSSKPKEKPVTSTPIPIFYLSALRNYQTESLQEVKETVRMQKLTLQLLSEQEKNLPSDELERKWAEERFESRHGPCGDRPLSEEEKLMHRAKIARILAEERREHWVQSQRERGFNMFQCNECGRWEKANDYYPHHCFRAPYTCPLKRRRGVHLQQQLVVETIQGDINIKHQPVVDLNKLLKEKEALSKTIEQVKHSQQSWKPEVRQPEVSNATPMTLILPDLSNKVDMTAESSTDAVKHAKINMHTTRPFRRRNH